MQRLRLKFCRGEEVKFISHLDIMRLWQRALQRAGVALAYSEGFSPHPRMSLAAPLALGVTSEAELMDIVCAKWTSPHWLLSALSRQLPPGIKIVQIFPVTLTMPSLQSQVRFAEYEVELESKKSEREIEEAIEGVLAKKHLPWQHQRDTGPRSYDLRALIDDLWLIEYRDSCASVGMKLRCDGSGSGRPEQVAAALGFTEHPRAVHRTRLIFET